MSEGRGGVGYVLRKFPVLSETFVLGELLALEARGVPLHVISLERPNDPRYHEDLPKLKARITYLPEPHSARRYLRIHWRLSRSKKLRKRYWRTLLGVVARGRPGLLWRFVQAGFVANEVRRLKLKHLHAHFAHYPTTVTQLAARMTGTPFSFTAHATDIYKHGVDREALARKIKAARFVITVSTFNLEYLRELTGAGNGKVTLIHNGIDLSRFAPNGTPPRSPFRLLCVARLVEKKGLPVLVEACRLLSERGLDFRCEIIGKGRMRSQLTAQIQRDSLRERVKLLGPMTQLEVRNRYHAAHAYVLPAIVGADGNREGLPVSIVEALSSGLPVVTTPVTGIPEVVRDEVNGLLVPPGDAVALTDALQRLIADEPLYERLRAAARRSVVEVFDQRRTSAALQSLLEAS